MKREATADTISFTYLIFEISICCYKMRMVLRTFKRYMSLTSTIWLHYLLHTSFITYWALKKLKTTVEKSTSSICCAHCLEDHHKKLKLQSYIHIYITITLVLILFQQLTQFFFYGTECSGLAHTWTLSL